MADCDAVGEALLKRTFLIYALSAALAAAAGAVAVAVDCRYFLVKTRVDSCKAVRLSENELAQTAPMEDDPLIADPATRITRDEGRRVRLRCACRYSLYGSDLRCDFDREEALQVQLVEPNARKACRGARRTCQRTCPSEWP